MGNFNCGLMVAGMLVSVNLFAAETTNTTTTTTTTDTTVPATTVAPADNTTTAIVVPADTAATTSATPTKNGDKQTTPTQFISDAAITAKVKTELLASKDISSLSISVATNKGVVTLTGKVESLPQKEQVVKITSQISGVKSVVDQLTVEKI